MFLRYILGALLFGFLGFAVQFLMDVTFMHPERTKVDGTIAWECGGTSQAAYVLNGDLDRFIAYKYRPEYRSLEKQLLCEYILVDWMQDRGEIATHTAVCASFVWLALIFAKGQLRSRPVLRMRLHI